MRKLFRILPTIIFLLPISALAEGPAPARVSVCFTPGEDCAGEIVKAILSAKRAIHVQAYGFSSPVILKALLGAAKRGVKVEVILDKSNDRTNSSRSRYTGATLMANAGVPVWIDYKPAIAHNKVIVIDDDLVVGGSFNYTKSAQSRNAENVTFIASTAVAAWFLDNWERRRAEAREFTP